MALQELLRWFREAWSAEMPVRLHDRGTEDDGAPHWHAAFRSYLTGNEWATDQDGTIRRPIRAHWSQMAGSSGRGGRRARYLFVLACSDFDPLLAYRRVCPLGDGIGAWADDVALDYAEATLQRFHDRCQVEPRRFLPTPKGAMARVGKSESQHRAEEAGRAREAV